MLKLLYKTLLISTMSCSLMTMNMTAFAFDVDAPTTTIETPTRDANGVVTVKEKTEFKSVNQENVESSQTWIDGITMLVIGMVGARLLMYTKWSFDMKLAAIGSAAYLGSEVITMMNYNDAVGAKTLEVIKKNDGKENQTQLDSLNELKASYEKVKGSLKTKLYFQIAAAVAFGAATVLTSYNILRELFFYSAAKTAKITATAALASCQAAVATVAGAEEAAFCTACHAQLEAVSTQLEAYTKIREVPKKSSIKFGSLQPLLKTLNATIATPCPGVTAAAVKKEMDAAAALELKNMWAGDGYSLTEDFAQSTSMEKRLFAKDSKKLKSQIDSSSPNNFILKNIIEKMLNSVFSKAEAGWGGLIGFGVGATAVLLLSKKFLGKFIDNLIYTPGLRIAVWGVMGLAASAAAISTQYEIDTATANIKKIDAILVELQTLKDGVQNQNIQNQQIQFAAFSAGQNQGGPGSGGPAPRTDCLSGGGDQNCPPLADNFQSMPGFSDLPDSFKSIVSQTNKFGNTLGGKSSLSGDTLAKDLGGKLGAIAKLKTSLRNKINDALKKNGKPQIDFDKNEKNLWANMNAQTSKILAANHMSPGAFLAGTGISPISSAEAAVAKMPTQNNKPIAGGGEAGGAGKDKGLDLDFKEAKDPNEALGAQGAVVADGAHKAEKFDIGTNDINTNSSESIFSVISNRYLKSGYPKLLEEIPAKK